jgi:2-polyprenyl-6-methoxyphenol hydroxylase-like FAD-dependent oxidoreductase
VSEPDTRTRPDESDRTVVIVGAGPIGLLLATELGRAGVRAVVLERRTETDLRSPAMAINGATVELLDQAGLLEPLKAQTMPLPVAHFAHLWLDLAPLAGRHESSLIAPQWRIEKLLEARARDLGVDVRRGVEVTGLTQDDDGVTLTTTAGPVRGAYLVGADGWRSPVRRLAGIDFPLRRSRFYGLVGDLEADWSSLRPGQLGAAYSPVGGTYAGTPTEPGTVRVSTAEWGVEPEDPDAPVTLAELNARVERLTGTTFTTATPKWLTRVENPTANAETYRAGRVFLVGDAAHVFFPFNGQRLSTGFQDATNLGWKLAADLRGDAPPGLLDSYHAERHPAAEWAIATVSAQESLVDPAQGAAALRTVFTALIEQPDTNRLLAETVMGLAVRYPLGEGPLVGRRLPHVGLKTAEGETSVAAILRPGRGVLLNLTGTAARAAEGYPGRVDVVTATGSPDIPATAVLLRPDGHVAWAEPIRAGSGGSTGADGADGAGSDLAAALRTWFGAPDPATRTA